MAFKLDDMIIDRVQYGWAEDFDGNPLYVLTQLSDATINISAESKDAVDSQGTLIKRFWQGKTGEFTANNAMINVNILGAASGEGKHVATEGKPIQMPKIVTVKAGTTITLKDYVDGTVTVTGFSGNGSMGAVYKKGSVASETDYALTSEGALTPPTDPAETQYIVKYERNVKSGVAIYNKADKFPQTVKLTLKALAVDPCTADTLRGVYIELPSFQVSPEIEISLTTDAKLAYSGALQADYCASDKSLYRVFFADEEEDDE